MGFAARSRLMLSTAMRLRTVHTEAPAQGHDTAIPLSQKAPARSSGLPVEFLFRAAPLVCGVLLLTSIWIGREPHRFGVVLPEHFIPWLLVALGVAWGARIGFRYNGEFQPARVNDLVEDLSVSQMRPRAVEIEGEIVGNARPGARWSPDLVLNDDSGSMFLLYRSSLPLGRLFFAFQTADRLVGEHVKVQGWYRRGRQPYIEIARIEACVPKPAADSGPVLLLAQQQQRRRPLEYAFLVERSYSKWIQLQLSAACAAAGIIWLLGIY
jgi:hypothetical protein